MMFTNNLTAGNRSEQKKPSLADWKFTLTFPPA